MAPLNQQDLEEEQAQDFLELRLSLLVVAYSKTIKLLLLLVLLSNQLACFQTTKIIKGLVFFPTSRISNKLQPSQVEQVFLDRILKMLLPVFFQVSQSKELVEFLARIQLNLNKLLVEEDCLISNNRQLNLYLEVDCFLTRAKLKTSLEVAFSLNSLNNNSKLLCLGRMLHRHLLCWVVQLQTNHQQDCLIKILSSSNSSQQEDYSTKTSHLSSRILL